MNIDARVERLARAMCEALDIDPDETFSHGFDWRPYPTIDRTRSDSTIDVLMFSPNWLRFAWKARMFLFENSGGEFGC